MKINKFLSIIRVLFTPGCWTQINPYFEGWDRDLRELMQKHPFIVLDRYHAEIGGRKIWIANHPYGSFTNSQPGFIFGYRPKRSTILYAMDKLKNDLKSTIKSDV